MHRFTFLKLGYLASLLLVTDLAFATNGYFQIGYGPKQRALVGAGTALFQDAMAPAVNPAGILAVDRQVNVSLELFSPDRSATSGFGGQNRSSTSDNKLFPVPNFGYIFSKDANRTIGLTVYANGGMNTTYRGDTPGAVNLYGSPRDLGVNMTQLIFAPTLAVRKNERHGFGISLLAGYQRFKAYGLQNFCSLRQSLVTAGDATCATTGGPGTAASDHNLTDQGTDSSYGLGVRVGWYGKLTEKLDIGAAYATKMYMREFDKYKELFAENGDFDVPANMSIGLAFKATSQTTLAVDVQKIFYSDIASIANRGPTTVGMNVFAEGQGGLGAGNGLGFGWRDMTIYKLGLVHRYDSRWTFRGGLSYGTQPIPASEVTLNIMAPAVIEKHLAAGCSYRLPGSMGGEVIFTYNHALENDVTGDFAQAFGGTPGAAQTRLEMDQNTFDIGYTRYF